MNVVVIDGCNQWKLFQYIRKLHVMPVLKLTELANVCAIKTSTNQFRTSSNQLGLNSV